MYCITNKLYGYIKNIFIFNKLENYFKKVLTYAFFYVRIIKLSDERTNERQKE